MSGRKRFLLDTNAVVALLSGNQPLLELLNTAEWIGVSIISKLEFLSFPHLTPQDAALFTAWTQRVDVVGLNAADVGMHEQAVEIRKKRNVRLPDAIILATAMQCNAQLITADKGLLKAAENVAIPLPL